MALLKHVSRGLVFAGLLAAGCHGGGGAAAKPDGGSENSDTGVSQGDTGVAMMAQTVGPSGGVVAVPGGTSVTVPPNAVTAPTAIAVADLGAAAAAAGSMPGLPGTVRPASDAFALTPHGVTFAAPVTVHVAFDAGLATAAGQRPLRLYTAAPGGAWTAVPNTRVVSGALEADVMHFSYFVVGFEAAQQTLPATQRRKVDLLFMVDNSTSMQPLQAKLTAGFPALIQTLKNLPGGLPDVHIGVVSSSMGAGQFTDIPGCAVGGDHGLLQNQPRIAGCQPPRDAYIAAGENEATRNYDGTIEDTFSCIAALGDRGCGYEHQLEAVAVALGARGTMPPENAGFLRSDALLAIVLITNEDDCSAPPDAQIFSMQSLLVSDQYGPPASYRCNEYGHRCGGSAPPRMAPAGGGPLTLTDCHSAEDGTLNKISDYIAMFKALKADPRDIFISAIAGPQDPYTINWTAATAAQDPAPWPSIAHSCMTNAGEFADPSVRIAELVGAFGANGSLSSICGDFAPGLTGIGAALTQAMGPRCLQAAVVNTSGAAPALRAGCKVVESVVAGGQVTEHAVAACGAAAAGQPCWSVTAAATCSETGAALSITRSDTPPAGAVLVVRCE